MTGAASTPGRAAAVGLPARRRLSRTLALQLLFQRDLSGGADLEQPGLFRDSFAPDRDKELALGVPRGDFEAAWPLAVELYLGVARELSALDGDIAASARNWRVDRMDAVDRSLIRLAYYEMRFRPDIPVKAVLNEAVELAKAYGNPDSQAFVNGILDRLARTLGEARAAAGSAPSAGRAGGGAGAAPGLGPEGGAAAAGDTAEAAGAGPGSGAAEAVGGTDAEGGGFGGGSS
ncbi:MAG: transcription antitermination factor NusB [Deltaproteobacteria bacterium]|jgi:N utilization substance protein B|nr:transcription antitermination factor NusB [Deltaproteobacteria bacterium]